MVSCLFFALASAGFGEEVSEARQNLLSDLELSLFVPFDDSIQPELSQKPLVAVSDDVDRFEAGIFRQITFCRSREA